MTRLQKLPLKHACRRMHIRRSSDSGFTIVELLIVIVVIGILAAIVIVAFSGIQDRANSAAVQSDLKNFGKMATLFHADNGAYPGTVNQLNGLGWKASMGSYQQNSMGNALYCAIVSGTTATFVIAARTKNNTAYTYSPENGLQQYTGAWTGAWATDCPIFIPGYPTTATPNYFYAQGYHPPGWGSPGWRVWTGGTL